MFLRIETERAERPKKMVAGRYQTEYEGLGSKPVLGNLGPPISIGWPKAAIWQLFLAATSTQIGVLSERLFKVVEKPVTFTL